MKTSFKLLKNPISNVAGINGRTVITIPIHYKYETSCQALKDACKQYV